MSWSKVCLLPLLAAVLCSAQDRRVRSLEERFIAPCCWSEPVSVHRSPLAGEMRSEIARMVARRLSNKDIGSALDISARTVSTHLSNIFGKLGVDSRGELADFIRDHSLLEDS